MKEHGFCRGFDGSISSWFRLTNRPPGVESPAECSVAMKDAVQIDVELPKKNRVGKNAHGCH
jgi:hypothetical protein